MLVGTHRNRLGQLGQTKVFSHVRRYFNLIQRIHSGQPVTRGAPGTSESAGHHFGMLYPESIYSVLGQCQPLYILHMGFTPTHVGGHMPKFLWAPHSSIAFTLTTDLDFPLKCFLRKHNGDRLALQIRCIVI